LLERKEQVQDFFDFASDREKPRENLNDGASGDAAYAGLAPTHAKLYPRKQTHNVGAVQGPYRGLIGALFCTPYSVDAVCYSVKPLSRTKLYCTCDFISSMKLHPRFRILGMVTESLLAWSSDILTTAPMIGFGELSRQQNASSPSSTWSTSKREASLPQP